MYTLFQEVTPNNIMCQWASETIIQRFGVFPLTNRRLESLSGFAAAVFVLSNKNISLRVTNLSPETELDGIVA